jgi:hypothetical protein
MCPESKMGKVRKMRPLARGPTFLTFHIFELLNMFSTLSGGLKPCGA